MKNLEALKNWYAEKKSVLSNQEKEMFENIIAELEADGLVSDTIKSFYAKGAQLDDLRAQLNDESKQHGDNWAVFVKQFQVQKITEEEAVNETVINPTTAS
jgi:hypothetical protein